MDEAAKKAVYASKVAKGMDPRAAASETLKDMIDYAHRSPLVNTLSDYGLANFAKFATAIPGAVGRAAVRNPRRLALLNRVANGAITNGSQSMPGRYNDNGKTEELAISTPISEAAEAYTDPVKYARAKASDPVRVGGTLLGDLLNHGKSWSKYPTYGQPLLPHMKNGKLKSGYIAGAAANDGPLGVGQDALNALEANEYSPEDVLSQLLGPTVGGYVR
jgi:hypothetical protein